MKQKNTSTAMQAGNLKIDTLIGEHAHFQGEMTFEGAIRIDGQFTGNIKSTQDGTLIVSEAAQITGEVDVPHLLLHGTITGNVRATKGVQIGSNGKINGDVAYALITLVEGGVINGRCSRLVKKTAVAGKPAAPARADSASLSLQTSPQKTAVPG